MGRGLAEDQAQGLEHTRQALYPKQCASSAALLVTVRGLYLWVWGDTLIVHLQQPAALLY